MKNITIVGTTHSELGQCNEAELLRILRVINPDVVFEEIRPLDHEFMYQDRSRHTVEMRAICSFQKIKSIKQVPVDSFSVPGEFKEGVETLFKYVNESCASYRDAISNIDRIAYAYGYRFLSSLKHIELCNEADELFENAVASSNSEQLKRHLSMWYYHLRKREGAMVENIYSYSRSESFEKGVFLVGAGHMSYLAKIIEARLGAGKSEIGWAIWSG